MAKGNIGVTTDNIFPVIKKFLYSDHEIFLREIVSNAVDATQKMRTLASVGEFKGELNDLRVEIKVDKEAKTITVSDHGIGMTAEEIEKYINQIAFSGATDFLDKYKNDANAIIGHFGLGFYSAFMVSDKVEIFTLSYKEGATAQHWSCDGSPQYTLEECDKTVRGTDIVLHIADDEAEFLEQSKISSLLNKYCKFLPVEIAFGKKKEWKEGKEVETDELNIINTTKPTWTIAPSELKEEDYEQFYRSLYPMAEDPLFHIHLNVDYPFNLTGILYFPRITQNVDLQRNKIQLYCNQVFVTDSVEGIVPDYLTLLHGVIDSPDIPLNVSRSYLQSDSNVKKISSHITKKVADSLNDIFKNNRQEFEQKWDDLKIFIVYGMLTDEKFYDRAKDFFLFKNSEGKYFTMEEYKTLISAEQTDKNGDLIYLYASNLELQHTYIEAAKAKGYDVLLMNGQLDSHFVGQHEHKNEKCRFVRVDSDVVSKLIVKDEAPKMELTDKEHDAIKALFETQMPQQENTRFDVTIEAMGENAAPIVITQNEFMRRMKEMSATGGGQMMMFYGQMPDSYNIVLNANHRLVKSILADATEKCADKIAEIEADKEAKTARKEEIKKSQEGLKEDQIPTAQKEELDLLDAQIGELDVQKRDTYAGFACDNDLIHQLIDLALLQNGMLKGEKLAQFVNRSIEML